MAELLSTMGEQSNVFQSMTGPLAAAPQGEHETKQARSEVWSHRSAVAWEKLFEHSGLNAEGIDALKEYVECKVGESVAEMWAKGKTMMTNMQREVAALRAENAELRGTVQKLCSERSTPAEGGCSTSTTSGTSPPGSQVESELGTPETYLPGTHAPGLPRPQSAGTAPSGTDFSATPHVPTGPAPPSPMSMSELPTGLGFGGAPGLPPISPMAQMPMPPLSPALLSPFHFGAAAHAAAAAAAVAAQQQHQQQQHQHPALHMPQCTSPFGGNAVSFGGPRNSAQNSTGVQQELPRLSLAQALGDLLPKLPKAAGASEEGAKDLAPQVASQAPTTFTVSLRKVDTDLGLGVRHCPEDECLTVEEICPGGAAEAWNLVEARHGSARLIKQGDSILSINGVSLNPAKMLEECGRSETLTLLLRREEEGAARAREEEEEDEGEEENEEENEKGKEGKEGNEAEGEERASLGGAPLSGLRANASVFVPRSNPPRGAGN